MANKNNKKQNNNKEPLLTEDQANWLVEFAKGLNDAVYGIYTPQLLNQNLRNLNSRNREPNYDSILKALSDAVNRGEELAGYQEWLEYSDMIFKKVIEYYSTMLSFDLSYTAINVQDKSEYESTKYKKDKKAVEDFLTQFDYKGEFAKVVKQVMRSETAFMWLRNNGDTRAPGYALQLMPQKSCMITGVWEKNLLYDFDLNYFQTSGVDIMGFDPALREKLADMYKQDGKTEYMPTNKFNNRNGSFSFWVQTSPYNEKDPLPSGAWVFKRDMSNYNSVPYLSALMRDAILNIPTKKLQYDKNCQTAYGYLVGEIGMLKANEQDSTQFKPTTLGALLNIVRNALGDHIKVGAMPMNEIKMHQYKDDNTTMAEDQYKSTLATGTSASRILYATDKMSQEEVRNAILSDYNFIKPMYDQFNNFLDFYVNKLTKKYKFKFAFDGSNYNFERLAREDSIMKLAETGIVLNETAFASAFGYDPVMFGKMLQETSADNSWISNLSQLQSIHTASGKSGSPGSDSISSDSRDYDYASEEE